LAKGGVIIPEKKEIICFGSINIDQVFRVPHFVNPGETLSSIQVTRQAGGKGLNQAIALARAGAVVSMAGKIGPDGLWLKKILVENGINTESVLETGTATGQAIIQVVPEGENAILLNAGANHEISVEEQKAIFDKSVPGSWILVQNEISSLAEIINLAADKNLKVAFNPSPFSERVLAFPLDRIDLFIVNHLEGKNLMGESEPEKLIQAFKQKFPKAGLVLTMGSEGAWYADSEQNCFSSANPVKVVDTTAAGDTFLGYFLSGLITGQAPQNALALAGKAAAVCVTRPGAAVSIPFREELNKPSPT